VTRSAALLGTHSTLATIIRWLLVLPVAWLGWAISVGVAFLVYGIAEGSCPREQVISEHCAAPWFGATVDAIFIGGSGLAAALILIGCTLMAPNRRRMVALATYVVGVGVALNMAIAATAWGPFVSAILVGALALLWMRSRGWFTKVEQP
jgi:hypothetical protein